MSTQTRSKPKSQKSNGARHTIVWFQIPADDVARAKKFYSALFGWKINPFPNSPPGEHEYIDTGGADASPDGGLIKRKHPEHAITTYVGVPSVTKLITKIEKLGGSICEPKTPVPGTGYFAICKDTENNTFAIWEANPKAK
jgi:predicted enzyme related to lactoylglutathione lyase